MQEKKVLITAHAGCMGTKANTIASVLAAVRSNCDIIELDVRTAKDETIILMHDSYVRVSNEETKHIGSMDFNEIAVYVKDIAKLEEALLIIKDHNKVANLDLKSPEALEKIVKIVKALNVEDNIIFSGCGEETAKLLQANYPRLKYLLNVEDDVSRLNQGEYNRYVEKTCKLIKDLGCTGINICYEDCTEKLVKYAHLNGIPVYIWTVDDEDKMIKFISMKVDSITTNSVNTLDKILSKI